jgi:hypothetical protein
MNAAFAVSEVIPRDAMAISNKRFIIGPWDEYPEIGEEEFEAEEDIDFESILEDDRYLQWAESHGLDAEDWARKTVHIAMMV